MKKGIIVICIFTMQLFVINAFAEKAPIKFGKVSIEELEMTHYEKDSTAPAVVICEYGFWNLRDYKFRKIVRIKILTAEGLEYANNSYPSDDGTTVRGKTYNLVNGEIEVTKLKNESIYKERIYEDYYDWNIAMPNVKIGSVIDIEYSHFGIPSEWRFQKDIPVIFSELIIPESMYIQYSKRSFGHEKLSLYTSNHWVARNMPAFKAEPFVNSADNYVRKFEFDVKEYTFPGYYREFTTDWNAVARRLHESSYFGQRLNAALFLKTKIKEIELQDSTKYGRMKLAYEAAKQVKWNDETALQTTYTTLGTCWKEKIGNVTDINLILVNLLRKLDLNANPLVLSTRSNGTLSAYRPSINKLNYVIAHVVIDDQNYLLDATEEYAPIGILPKRCLNNFGQILIDNKAKPAEIYPNKKHVEMSMLSLQLQEDLTIKGSVTNTYREYAALTFRNSYYTFNSADELIEDYEKQNTNIRIIDYETVNLENHDKSLQEKYTIEVNNQIQKIDSLWYLNPMLHLKTTDNPFKLKERKYPVDFAYASLKKHIIQMSIPDGFYVSEKPKPIVMSLPDNGGKISYQVQLQGNMISIIYNFNIAKPFFSSKEYELLRELYNQIIKIHAEPIVLGQHKSN